MAYKAKGPSSDEQTMALHRSDIYRLLARVFRKEPDLDLIRGAKDKPFLEILDEMEIRFDDDFLDVPDETLVDILGLEYTRLFVGPGKHIPPYESVHHQLNGGGWGSLWGKSTAQVNSFMKTAGLELKQKYENLPDHISVEFEFISEVCKREAKAREQNDYEGTLYLLDMENKFIGDHLIKWTPVFCDKVIEETSSSFYKAMARLTKDYIKLDNETVGATIDSTLNKAN
jgi:TorA maturation chaperone TorD